MNSKQQIGHDDRVAAMTLLTRLGYASTRQLAVGVYGSCTLSTRNMTSRMLRDLLGRGYLVEKRDGASVNGERLVALTRAGVNALARAAPLPAGRKHGRDWLRHAHAHRTACNSVFAAWLGIHAPNHHLGSTELEIQSGLAPAQLVPFRFRSDGELHQKIPDLLLAGANGAAPIWAEIENSWRGARDFRKLIGFLRSIFNKPEPPVSKVLFVSTSPASRSIGARLRAALSHEHGSGYSRIVQDLDRRILDRHIEVMQLDPDRMTLGPIADQGAR